jgi:hypothetical protein
VINVECHLPKKFVPKKKKKHKGDINSYATMRYNLFKKKKKIQCDIMLTFGLYLVKKRELKLFQKKNKIQIQISIFLCYLIVERTIFLPFYAIVHMDKM